jgi:DNA helicase HerA-like ATPase
MSQLGTRITALLNDDRDIDRVFTGIRGGSQLKNLLSTLDSKQEVMLMGHAVPMEVVLRVRNFDTEFYNALKSTPKAAQEIDANVVKAEKAKLSLEDLFGD